MAIDIKKEFELTEVQLKRVPYGKKLHFHLTYPKQKNGDIYVVSVASFTGKDKNGVTRSCNAGTRLLGRFVKGDRSVLVPTRPRNWKQLEQAKKADDAAKEKLKELEKNTPVFNADEVEAVNGLIHWIQVVMNKTDAEGKQKPVLVRFRRDAVFMVAVLSGLHGGFDATSIADYWNRHGAELAQCVPGFINERISSDTVRQVLCTTPESVSSQLLQIMYKRLVDASTFRNVNLDGQVARASRNEETGLPFQIAGVFDSTTKLWVDHIRIAAKTNEIPTFPEMVKAYELHNTLVTTDALNTVTPLADAILGQGGNYCLAVKDNKGGLADAIKDHFQKPGWEQGAKRLEGTEEKSHGRIDKRDYFFLPADRLTGFTEKWQKLAGGTIAMVVHFSKEVRERFDKVDNKTVQAEKERAESTEVRYYISSIRFDDPKMEECLSKGIRGHWGIESAHWVLDVDFGQDWQQCKNPEYLMTTSTLRKCAANFLQMILQSGGTELSEDSLRRLSHNLDRPIQALKAIAKACPQMANTSS